MGDPSSNLRARIDAFGGRHRLSQALLDRWRMLAEPDAAALLALAEQLRLGENHLRDVFEWAEEIAVRQQTTIAAVLASEPVRAVMSRGLGRNDAIKAVRHALRRVRFPQLVAIEEQLADRVRALGLPPEARVILPAHLEESEVRIEIRATSAAQLRGAVDRLRDAVNKPELAEIFELLAEAP